MPTAKHQQDLLQRLNESFRHGTLEIRNALSSNSLQKSPTVTDGKDGKKNDGGNGNNTGKKNGKKNKGRNGDRNPEGGNTSRDTSSNGSEEPKLDKKTKRKLDIATTCSLHGLNAGHSDAFCFDDPNTDENKKKIEANRADPKMKAHFREIDHAAHKRKKAHN